MKVLNCERMGIMEENTKKVQVENSDEIEYEDVKRLPLGAFIGIGLAFGVAAGFSLGNLLISKMFGHNIENGFLVGMTFCVVAGIAGGLILGLINKAIKKK